MANTLATLVVQFSADVAKFHSDLGKAASAAESRFGQISGAARKAAGLVGLSLGGISFGAIFKEAIEQAKEAEQASNRLTAVLRATGNAAGLTKDQLDGMAEAMAKSTQFDDESIRNAASEILKFKNIQGETFRETLKLSADVAAFFGDDIPSAAAKLAKSMEDPEAAFGLLRKAGIVLTQQQKDQIKAMGDAGDRAGQQDVILKKLQGTFGGTADIMNTGLTRATRDVTKAWNELLESFGKTGPVKTVVEGSLLSIAGALNAVREAQEKSSKQFKERALSPGIHVDESGVLKLPTLSAKQIPGAAPLRGGEFNDQLNKLPAPEMLSPEEAKARVAARAAATAQALKSAADLLLQLSQKTAAARLGAIKSAAQNEAEAAKNHGQRVLELFELHHEAALISIGTFYEARTAIQRASLSAEISALDKSIAAQRAAMGALKEPEQKITANAAINAELAKRAELVKQIAQVGVVNAMKETRANQDLRDALAQVNIELLKQRGNLTAATAAEAEQQSRELRKKAAIEFGPGSAEVMAIDLAGGNKVRDAQLQLNDAIAAVNVQIMRELNLLGQAAAVDFDVQNRQLIERIRAEQGYGTAAENSISRLRELTVASADFNKLRTEQGEITSRLQLDEERIQNALRTGAIGELTALQRTGDARKAAGDQLAIIVRRLEEVAIASQNPALILQAEQARAALERLRTETDLLAERFNTVFSDSFSSAVADFVSQTKSAKEAFKSFSNSVIKNLNDMYAKQLATGLFGGGSAGGGIGGALADVFRKAFAGGGSTSNASAISAGQAMSMGGATSGALEGALLGSFAVGTDFVPRTGPYLLHQGERVTKANESTGGVTVINNNDFRGVDASVVAQIERKLVMVERTTVARVENARRRSRV